ncbi:MAG: hypothetical protein NTW86_15695 [Candidatus Sumerlaeota bacterium]|nr:hypothetical protein [Candidatus Sumerlaeota bacterium]
MKRPNQFWPTFHLALGGLAFVVGTYVCFDWMRHDIPLSLSLIHLTPGLVFLAAWCAWRNSHLRRLHVLAVLALIGCAGFWGFLAPVYEFFYLASAETTRIRRYDEIMRANPDSEILSHFSRFVPPDAQHAKMSAQPGFLQGGSHLQLRYDTTPERIDALYRQFAERTTKSFYGGDAVDHMNQDDGMFTIFFYTADGSDHTFPPDYEVMVFDRLPTAQQRQKGIDWNHGQSHGVAISKQRNEIVYWQEQW